MGPDYYQTTYGVLQHAFNFDSLFKSYLGHNVQRTSDTAGMEYAVHVGGGSMREGGANV